MSKTKKSCADTTTTKIYINMIFSQLAEDINNNTLAHQFSGKGRKITFIKKEQEPTYLYYSSDKAGVDIIYPPFEINDGDNIKFKLQAAPEQTCKSFRWNGIVQSNFDLKLVSGTNSTYNADVSEAPDRSKDDEVTISINFKLDKVKFSANWDPQIKIRKA